MHWRAQCHAKWQRRCSSFQDLSGINPKSPDYLQLALTTKPLVCINRWKKRVYDSLYFATCNQIFFAYRIDLLRLFKLNFKARYEIREFLNANLWSILLFAFDIGWSWIFFIEHSLTLKKWEATIWNLGQTYKIKLWMVGQNNSRIWVDECLQKKIAQKFFELKIEAWSFKHCISFATSLAANFGGYRFRITPYLVSKLLHATIWSHCAVLLNLSRRPFHRQVVNLDLLLCKGFNSEHIVFFLCHIFTWRPMTDRKIEQSYGHCNNFLPIPSKFHFIWKKKSDSSLPEIYKALKPCCHLNWISIARVVACFPQATWSLPSETATN